MVDGVAISAQLAYSYDSSAFVASGSGTLRINGLHDDGSSLHVAVYPILHSGHKFFLIFLQAM